VCPEDADDRRRDGDRPTRAGRLWLIESDLSADTRQSPPNPERSGVEVNVAPAQGQRLTLAQARGQGQI
jgi:hypothetical protein